MVSDVGLADAVGDVRANGAEEVAVDGRESAAGKGPLGCRVVGEDGVGVLKERDHDEPAAWGQHWKGRRLGGAAGVSSRRTHWLTQR